MSEEENILQRVRLLIREKNTNINALARSMGIAQGTLNSQLIRGTVHINVVTGILRVYPDISPDWLLFGSGPMVRPSYAWPRVAEIARELQNIADNALALKNIPSDAKS